jgi:hypothetical protein
MVISILLEQNTFPKNGFDFIQVKGKSLIRPGVEK